MKILKIIMLIIQVILCVLKFLCTAVSFQSAVYEKNQERIAVLV